MGTHRKMTLIIAIFLTMLSIYFALETLFFIFFYGLGSSGEQYSGHRQVLWIVVFLLLTLVAKRVAHTQFKKYRIMKVNDGKNK